VNYRSRRTESLFLNLPQSQLGCLHLILNSSARAVSKAAKFGHISPVLKSLSWLKIEQRIQYKVASITNKVLQSKQPSFPNGLLTIQSNRSTRSSDIITLQRPHVHSRLKSTDISFTHHAPVLWNSLPLRQPFHIVHSPLYYLSYSSTCTILSPVSLST